MLITTVLTRRTIYHRHWHMLIYEATSHPAEDRNPSPPKRCLARQASAMLDQLRSLSMMLPVAESAEDRGLSKLPGSVSSDTRRTAVEVRNLCS